MNKVRKRGLVSTKNPAFKLSAFKNLNQFRFFLSRKSPFSSESKLNLWLDGRPKPQKRNKNFKNIHMCKQSLIFYGTPTNSCSPSKVHILTTWSGCYLDWKPWNSPPVCQDKKLDTIKLVYRTHVQPSNDKDCSSFPALSHSNFCH